MILCKHRLLLLYWILLSPLNKAGGAATGKLKFYRSKYFDERSIHADIGRDMNMVNTCVKAFNGRDNDAINYAVDADDGGVLKDSTMDDPMQGNDNAINFASHANIGDGEKENAIIDVRNSKDCTMDDSIQRYNNAINIASDENIRGGDKENGAAIMDVSNSKYSTMDDLMQGNNHNINYGADRDSGDKEVKNGARDAVKAAIMECSNSKDNAVDDSMQGKNEEVNYAEVGDSHNTEFKTCFRTKNEQGQTAKKESKVINIKNLDNEKKYHSETSDTTNRFEDDLHKAMMEKNIAKDIDTKRSKNSKSCVDSVGRSTAQPEPKTKWYDAADVRKREVMMEPAESEGQRETVHHSPTAQPGRDPSKRNRGPQEEPLRKRAPGIMRQEIRNLKDLRPDIQYQHKIPIQDSSHRAQVSEHHPEVSRSQQYLQEPAGVAGEVGLAEVKENPMIAKLFEKQRQIENLKQLLMQVESKFQMEVNEVGRLQQSVSEAERELDDAVRLMQDVKLRNIRGLQRIEAAQDAAGRNLESKALKAHAEESQLAMHDQVLFSERQRLNALRAQMIYLQTELAAAQNSGILTFEDGEKTGYQSYGYHYKSPLTESLKYYQSRGMNRDQG